MDGKTIIEQPYAYKKMFKKKKRGAIFTASFVKLKQNAINFSDNQSTRHENNLFVPH